MKKQNNPNLVILIEDYKKGTVFYPAGTEAEIVGGWTGKKEDRIELLIRVGDDIIGNKDEIKHKKLNICSYEDIVGWFDFQDIYDEAVGKYKDGDEFLEIGCFMGKSTYYLCEKIKQSGKNIKATVVDIFEPECLHHEDLINENGGGSLLDIFKNNLSEYLDIITIVKGKSSDVAKQFYENQFKMIFIDAAHDYESVKADLNKFYPKLKSGGIFAGHDYGEKSCGVGQAVDEFIKENSLKLDIMTASWILIKP